MREQFLEDFEDHEEYFYEEDIYSSFVHILGRLKGQNSFCTSGSGCLIKYNNKCFLLTAAHVVSKPAEYDYFLEIRFDSDKGKTFFLQLSNGSWKIKRFCLTSEEVSDFDFAFYEIPCEVQPYFQEFKKGVSGPVKEYPKTIHQIDFDVQPEPIGKYAFAGLTRPEKVDGADLLMKYTVEVSYYAGLKNSVVTSPSEQQMTTDDVCVTDVYVFEPHFYRGDEYYQGCSGSPIMDNQNRVVSILIGGCSRLKQIYGVRLVAFKPIFEELTKPK
jgi:hypothetical protein